MGYGIPLITAIVLQESQNSNKRYRACRSQPSHRDAMEMRPSSGDNPQFCLTLSRKTLRRPRGEDAAARETLSRWGDSGGDASSLLLSSPISPSPLAGLRAEERWGAFLPLTDYLQIDIPPHLDYNQW